MTKWILLFHFQSVLEVDLLHKQFYCYDLFDFSDVVVPEMNALELDELLKLVNCCFLQDYRQVYEVKGHVVYCLLQLWIIQYL